MKAGEIRQFAEYKGNSDGEYDQNRLIILAEIAAQLSELNERLGALTGGSLEKQWVRIETK